MINLVVALPCEAQPIIKYFKLRKTGHAKAFTVYSNENIRLIISGVGKLFSGAATAYLYALSDPLQPQAWLNIGIAGHHGAEIGAGLLAHKVTDSATAHCFYPGLIFEGVGATAEILTVDQLERDFRKNVIYEMEAAGFYAVAARFSSCELIHCYKVVSDNLQSGCTGIDKQFVSHLVTDQLDAIEALVQEISVLLKIVVETPSVQKDFLALNQKYHFTVTQRSQLRQLLRRWYALGLGAFFDSEPLLCAHNSKDLIVKIRCHVNQNGNTY